MDNKEHKPKKNFKRKRKHCASETIKKFARQRDHGELDSETYQYLVQIMEVIRKEFPKMEEKQIFVDNVYEQTIGKEVDVAKNQVGSIVLETLLKYANFQTIVRLFDSFKESLRPFCSDRYASHVLEKLLCVCAHRGNLTEVEKKDQEVKYAEEQKYNEIALKLCKYTINNIEEFIWDTYANHILRTVFECLGGLIDLSDSGSNNSKKKSGPSLENRRQVLDEYVDLLKTTCKRFMNFPQFQEYNHNDLTSNFIQSVLYTLKDIDSDLNSSLIDKICTVSYNKSEGNNLSNIFFSECSIRLLEACIVVSNPKDFTNIYENFFENHIGRLSVMGSANFCVQRLFEHCHSKELLEKLFDEIVEHFEAILKKGYTGVLASLASACCRLHAKQGPFVNAITKILHCEEPKDRQTLIVPLVVTLKTFDEYDSFKSKDDSKSKVPLNLHGSLILQSILNFNKPIKVVNSLLGMSTEDLLKMFEDPKGSRIMDAFMQSQYIGEKSREKLFKNLRGTWVQLAGSTHGSRCLDRIWEWAKSNQRDAMMDELCSVGQLLMSTNAGRLIYTKLNVQLYSKNKKVWTEEQAKESAKKDKKVKVAAEFLEDVKKK
ncbi:nucleolar protein 9 [Copidosoma floridanum]|uniref:nucleolar protein 9 n=1 Tax=Copidosoma floridanum TaxID=29053 RepID=UPI0006C9CE18|nr:nucleolar protein 9 [Copidosoma floridanum]